MTSLPYISADFIKENHSYPDLVESLRQGFAEQNIIIPSRRHFDLDQEVEAGLLIMPAWEKEKDLGIKCLSIHPKNPSINLPAIQGFYIYLDSKTGVLKAILDATILTQKRTAAASALASTFLSRKDSEVLFMVGTGAMVPELIKAHASVRPIKRVLVWGRDENKATSLAESIQSKELKISVVKEIITGLNQADIISMATSSQYPLIAGNDLRNGQHLDLIGSYKPEMREVNNSAIKHSSVFIDQKKALAESGDLFIPIKKGIIKKSDIKADLFLLCKKEHPGRISEKETTLFKSVGFALEDLIAARHYYNLIKR